MSATHANQTLYFSDLCKQLYSATSSRERSRLVHTCSARFGRSKNWVYEQLHAVGWRSERKQRKDKGTSKLGREDLKLISGLLTSSVRKNSKQLLTMNSAIQVARDNDKFSHTVTPKTLSLRLKQEGMHPKQLARPTPHTTMRSLHPNHVWQLDASICVLFYLSNGGAEIMDERTFYKNKPHNYEKIKKQRVWRYVMTDHYSGAFYFKYYLAAGENQDLVFNFIMDAFTRRSHPQDPFHGVPDMLVWDKGSANQAYMSRNMLDRLDVEHHAHQVGNPRAKGQNECAQNITERDFEGRLVFEEIQSIEQLNDKAHLWMRYFNGTRKHTRHGATHYGLWQTIRQEQLRICPPREFCEQLLNTKPKLRQVRGDLTVSYAITGFGANDYSVAHVPGVRVKEYVDVCVNPYRAPSVIVYAHDAEGEVRQYECEPIKKNLAGFPIDAPVFGENFKRPPDTDVDRNRKDILKLTYGVETQVEVDDARRRRQPAFNGRIDPFKGLEDQTTAAYMDRPGIELDVPPAIEVEQKLMTTVQAARRLMARLGKECGKHAYAWLNTHYPKGVLETEFEEIVVQFSGGNPNIVPTSQQADPGG